MVYRSCRSNTLGRLDPKTGKIKEYPVKIPNSGPHGLVADKQGNIWFTANYKGYIGKLDPGTGKVIEYPMPDPAARGPHTPVFDQKGIIMVYCTRGQLRGQVRSSNGYHQAEAIAYT